LAAELKNQFGPRIRCADDDDRLPRCPSAGIVVDIGQFELLEHMVAQVQRLGRRLQPAGMLRQTGHVEQPGHRSRRHDEAIPRQVACALLGVGECDRATVEVHAVDPAADQLHPRQRVGERNRDEAGVDNAACHVGQQRCVEHVVDRRND
jgi:hypothetical protein